ncbi:MAG: hypothetical protein KC776_09635 [Myxococcales bacterium]|nr:hypothetical protein [Myxococcales bacterium]MCB9580400.1 hypothetical protein [Polyangiaceae bacterium]
MKLGLIRSFSMALALSAVGLSSTAQAEGPKPLAVEKTVQPARGWSDKSPDVGEAVRSGQPLVVEVFVRLCSEKRGGPCGKHEGAGEADNLDDNIYWGAVWGARRYLSRGYLGWKPVETGPGESWELERAVFSRNLSGARWGVSGDIEQIVVLHAIHGDSGEEALSRFRDRASGGGSVHLKDGRDVSVHVVGFMGRNPLLKNGKVPKEVDLPDSSSSSGAIPSFSIAAHSRETLGPWLLGTGSRALLLARGPVASEAYILQSVLDGVGHNDNTWNVEQRTIKSYAKFQKISEKVSALYFRRYLPKSLLPPTG